MTIKPVKVWPGKAYPLGATWDGAGVNFALFSENATAVKLCLFDDKDGSKEVKCINITEQTDQVWHVYLPEARFAIRVRLMDHIHPLRGTGSIK